jgi:hypothetical protein
VCRTVWYLVPRGVRGVSPGGEQFIDRFGGAGRMVDLQYGTIKENLAVSAALNIPLLVLVAGEDRLTRGLYATVNDGAVSTLVNLNFRVMGVLGGYVEEGVGGILNGVGERGNSNRATSSRSQSRPQSIRPSNSSSTLSNQNAPQSIIVSGQRVVNRLEGVVTF